MYLTGLYELDWGLVGRVSCRLRNSEGLVFSHPALDTL